jgi:hypothetical protein
MTESLALNRARELHSTAVASFVESARLVPADAWHEPIAEGKWSPAEVLAHLVCTCDTVLGELRGGSGMNVRTRFWARLLLRLTIVPGLLRGKPFPKGAVAPRDTRPAKGLDREEGLEIFRLRASELDEAARAARPGQKVTHAYFGSSGVADGVLLCARHIQHHTAQLRH